MSNKDSLKSWNLDMDLNTKHKKLKGNFINLMYLTSFSNNNFNPF